MVDYGTLATSGPRLANVLRDPWLAVFHLNEAHWVAGRISEQPKNNDSGHLKPRGIDRSAGGLDLSKFRRHVINAEIHSLLRRILSDCHSERCGYRNHELGRRRLPSKDVRVEGPKRICIWPCDVKEHDGR